MANRTPIRVRNISDQHMTWPDIVTCSGQVLSLAPGEEALVFELPAAPEGQTPLWQKHLLVVQSSTKNPTEDTGGK